MTERELAQSVADLLRSPEAREALGRFRAALTEDIEDAAPSRRPAFTPARSEAERLQRSAASYARLARSLYGQVPEASVVAAQVQAARMAAEARAAAGVRSPEERALEALVQEARIP